MSLELNKLTQHVQRQEPETDLHLDNDSYLEREEKKEKKLVKMYARRIDSSLSLYSELAYKYIIYVYIGARDRFDDLFGFACSSEMFGHTWQFPSVLLIFLP